jgi:hypothetical protein
MGHSIAPGTCAHHVSACPAAFQHSRTFLLEESSRAQKSSTVLPLRSETRVAGAAPTAMSERRLIPLQWHWVFQQPRAPSAEEHNMMARAPEAPQPAWSAETYAWNPTTLVRPQTAAGAVAPGGHGLDTLPPAARRPPRARPGPVRCACWRRCTGGAGAPAGRARAGHWRAAEEPSACAARCRRAGVSWRCRVAGLVRGRGVRRSSRSPCALTPLSARAARASAPSSARCPGARRSWSPPPRTGRGRAAQPTAFAIASATSTYEGALLLLLLLLLLLAAAAVAGLCPPRAAQLTRALHGHARLQ